MHEEAGSPGSEPSPRGAPATGAPGRGKTFVCVVILTLAASAGCDSVFGGSDWDVRVGTLSSVEAAASIEVPGSAVAGEPFSVFVRTGGGGCDRAAGTRVMPGSDRIAIVPHDSIYVGTDACPAVLRVFEHEARVTFREPGEKTVRFRVRDPATGSLVEIDRTVQVGNGVVPGSSDGPS